MAVIAIFLADFAPNYAEYQLAPLASQVEVSLGANDQLFSALFTAPMLASLLVSFAAGVLVDRFDSRLVLGSALLVSASGAVINLFAPNYPSLFTGFALLGTIAGFLTASSAKVFGEYFPAKEVPSKVGILFSAAALSAALATATTTLLGSLHRAFEVSAVVFLVALTAFIVLFREPDGSHFHVRKHTSEESTTEREPLSKTLSLVFKNKGVWKIGLCLFFDMGSFVFMASFVPSALTNRGIDPVAAGLYASLFTVGNFIGCFLVPALASRSGKPLELLALLGIPGTLGVAFGQLMPAGFVLAAAMLISGICVGGTKPLLASLPLSLNGIGTRYAGTAGGLVATMQLLGAIVLPTYVYIPLAHGNLQFAFGLAGACVLVRVVLCLTLIDKRQRHSQQHQAALAK